MSPQIITALIYLLMVIVVVLGLGFRGRKMAVFRRWLAFVVTSLLLTYLTLFEFNQSPIFLDEEADAVELLRAFAVHSVDADELMKDQEIILIDVSGDIALADDVKPMFADTSKLVITDRQKLANFLTWLGEPAQRGKFGAVVCDIFLEDSTEYDQDLKKAIAPLANAGKLMFAKHLNMQDSFQEDRFNIKHISYSVDITNYEGKYFSHNLIDADGRHTLPYELFLRQRTKQREPIFSSERGRGRLFYEKMRPNDPGRYVSNWLIPDLVLAEEEAGIKPDSETIFRKIFNAMVNVVSGEAFTDKTIVKATLMPISLGAATKGAKGYLSDALSIAEKGKKTVTIFVGNFSGERDLHDTVYGEMHGGLILLNTYLNLNAGRHHINWFYCFCLFLSFLAIVYFFLSKLYRTKATIEDTECGAVVNEAERDQNFLYHFYEGVYVQSISYWMLLGVFGLTVLIFHRVENVMAVALLFAVTDFAVEGIRKVLDSEKK